MFQIKFSNACNKFYFHQKVIGNQQATINAYKSHLKPFEVFCGNCDVSKITYEMYCNYIIFLQGKNISSVTIHDYARDLKIILKYFYKQKIIKNDIAYQIEKLPRQKSKMPDIIAPDVIKKILRDCVKDNVVHVRNCLMIILCYDCGLRRSELVRLEISDFDFFHDVIRINGKWNKQRNVPLTKTTRKFFAQYILLSGNRDNGKLFISRKDEPITKECVSSVFRRIKKKYRFWKFYPHLLRHSFATLFLLNGGDSLVLQQILGHTTLDMTKRYVHLANNIDISKNKCYSPLSFEKSGQMQKVFQCARERP